MKQKYVMNVEEVKMKQKYVAAKEMNKIANAAKQNIEESKYVKEAVSSILKDAEEEALRGRFSCKVIKYNFSSMKLSLSSMTLEQKAIRSILSKLGYKTVLNIHEKNSVTDIWLEVSWNDK